MSSVLRIDGLHKAFGGIVVASNISLSIQAGQILGLIGPNGAGKTSLFNLIAGVIAPDSGRISLGDVRIDDLPVHKRARLGLSRTWQNIRLFKTMSVLDNLLISTRTYPGESMAATIFRPQALASERREAKERATHVLERVRLADTAEKIPTNLPFGQQKLIGLARALMNEGDCLLLDEPMAGVEGVAYETMKNIVREEAEKGRGLCVVEHNISFIRDLCDSAIFMFNGRLIASGTVEDLIRDRRLTELYFGKEN